VAVTVDITAPDWNHGSDVDFLVKNDDGRDPPETVSAYLIAWSWPAGTEFDVYGDPCRWLNTKPATPATTPDEIAAGLAAQEESDPTTPVDVTIGGYAGKSITVTVPMSYHVEGGTRDEVFADCDQAIYGYYGDLPTEPARHAQGAGQIDELWILDVNGSIVILDGSYSPATPAELVEEVRAMAESATFEAP
jgi:hypothetical protein